MEARERRLARHEDERTALLEADIARAQQEVVAVARDEAGERLHAARKDEHAERLVGAARDGRGEIMAVVADVSECLDLRARERRLRAEVFPSSIRRDELRLDLRPSPQGAQEARRHDDAARAADADDEAAGLPVPRHARCSSNISPTVG